MSQQCKDESNSDPESALVSIERILEKNRSSKSKSVSASNNEPNKEQVVNTPPATFQSWLFGVLSGGQDSWILNYMNSEFYEIARNSIKERTGGRDIHVVIMACAALNAARVQVPVMLDALLNQVKSQVTSSIAISGLDSWRCAELLKLAREKSEESRKLRRFRGEHQIRAISGELSPLVGNTRGAFWHNGTHFTLEIQRSLTADNASNERVDTRDFLTRAPDPSGQITVRCWGHSREPITALFEDLQKRISESTKLIVVELQAQTGQDKQTLRNKRPLSTIDLDPKMMQDIIEDVELFFHKDSQTWYENSGRPYRHGYLFTGPPGSGKSSLLAGIALHINRPLYLINLQGMDDNDLREAFLRIPFRSCIGLEDIDCIGVDVSNRGAQNPNSQPGLNAQSSGSDVTPDELQMLGLETMMTKFLDKQAAANYKVLDQVKAIKSAALEYLSEDHDIKHAKTDKGKRSSDSTDSAQKSVTLSGLLNCIDGVNATEGRLIIMTTNHPEKLDPALYRAGRVDRKFEISYASKASSIMTFKRLFDSDVYKRYTSEAIHRFAQAFQAQFPSKSRITTAELAQYCGQYRGRPDIAVKEFADWLQRGADKFSCPIDYTNLVDEEGIYNVPEPFDEDLLKISARDVLDPVAAVASGIEVAASEVVQTKKRRPGLWNPIKAVNNLLLGSGEYVDLASLQDSISNIDLYAEHAIELSDDPLDHPLIPERQDVDTESCHMSRLSLSLLEFGVGLATPPLGGPSIGESSPGFELNSEFDNHDFSHDTEPLLKHHVSAVMASLTPSDESPWDEEHHNQASPVRSVVSVKFSEPGKLALASPRPIAADCTVLEHECNDSAVADSDFDVFETAREQTGFI